MWQLNAIIRLGSCLPSLQLVYSHVSPAMQPSWLEHRAPPGGRDSGETHWGPAAFPGDTHQVETQFHAELTHGKIFWANSTE